MIKRFFIIVLLNSILLLPVLASSGTAVDPSLTILNARQLGMGGASIGFSDDAGGIFSNPSRLAEINFPQLTGSSRKLLLDESQFSLFGWAFPSQWGTFGMGYAGVGTTGSLPTKLDPATGRIIIDSSREAIGYGSSVLALTYARKLNIPRLPNEVLVGGSLKFFNQSLSGGFSSRATATTLDLSAAYQPISWLTLGANLQNLVEGTLGWEGGSSDTIGGLYKLGFKVNILGTTGEAFKESSQGLYGGLDIDLPHSSMSGTNYHLGFEYFPHNMIALRSGLNADQNGSGFALGIGVINGGFRFDYAFSPRAGIPNDIPHYFTLSYVGERKLTVTKKPIRKEPLVRFIYPTDKMITDKESIEVVAEAKEIDYLEQKSIWAVTGISQTEEVKEITDSKDLSYVYLNGIQLDKGGTIESRTPLTVGRNVFSLVGYTSPEGYASSSEVRVLRFEPFTDLSIAHWAAEPIALCFTLKLTTGYPDNSFKPEKGITRAELITLLVRTLLVKLAKTEAATGFKDVPSNSWAAPYIAYGVYKKYATGYPDKTFKPNQIISRAEGITLLARYAELVQLAPLESPFPDLKTDFWANKYIGPAKDAGMLKYLEGKEFEPNKPFTRAEACEVLYRTPQIKEKVEEFWNTGEISSKKIYVAPAAGPEETPSFFIPTGVMTIEEVGTIESR